jgi:hypothetical protein
MGADLGLAGTGRGTAAGRGGGGVPRGASYEESPLHQPTAGPPPRSGEEFGVRAVRLAGAAGLAFGWMPETFWNATPAELGALVTALGGEEVAPLGEREIARLQELFPDG